MQQSSSWSTETLIELMRRRSLLSTFAPNSNCKLQLHRAYIRQTSLSHGKIVLWKASSAKLALMPTDVGLNIQSKLEQYQDFFHHRRNIKFVWLGTECPSIPARSLQVSPAPSYPCRGIYVCRPFLHPTSFSSIPERLCHPHLHPRRSLCYRSLCCCPRHSFSC